MGFVQIHDQGRHFLLDIQGRLEQTTLDVLESDTMSAHSDGHYAQQQRPIAFIHMRMVHVHIPELVTLSTNTLHGSRNMLTHSYPEAVAQLVKALRYKTEGHGFESRWCHRNFS